jgi:hypothetical protein
MNNYQTRVTGVQRKPDGRSLRGHSIAKTRLKAYMRAFLM